MNTIDVIKELINNLQDIKYFTFSKYPKQTLIQNTIELSEEDDKLISSALSIRKNIGLPFWDSLMVSCFDKENISINILSRALFHNSNIEKINTKEVVEIEDYIKMNPQENISINSSVMMNCGTVKHLFLLDFHIFPSDNNLGSLAKYVQA